MRYSLSIKFTPFSKKSKKIFDGCFFAYCSIIRGYCSIVAGLFNNPKPSRAVMIFRAVYSISALFTKGWRDYTSPPFNRYSFIDYTRGGWCIYPPPGGLSSVIVRIWTDREYKRAFYGLKIARYFGSRVFPREKPRRLNLGCLNALKWALRVRPSVGASVRLPVEGVPRTKIRT